MLNLSQPKNIDVIVACLAIPKGLDNNILDKKTADEFFKNFDKGVLMIKKNCKNKDTSQ